MIIFNRYSTITVKAGEKIDFYQNNHIQIYNVREGFTGSLANNMDKVQLITEKELSYNTCTDKEPSSDDKYYIGYVWFNVLTGDIFILQQYDHDNNPVWYKINTTKQSDIEEFLLIRRGRRIRYITDPIDDKALKNGFELFCPHSKEEYEEARKYLLAQRCPRDMGPLGIYYPKNGPGCCGWGMKNHALNSDDLGKLGWKVQDGSDTWWASDKTNISEPNGDYTAKAYLGITYDSYGNIYWYNDANSRYSYTNYLCVKRKGS